MPITEIDRATGLVSSAAYKAPCYLATTANITLAGEQTIDGVLTDESRVLVKDQTDATQNGIYITSTGDWTRAPDFSRNDQVAEGTRVWITDGSTRAQTEWVLTSADPVEIDTSTITFVGSAVLVNANTIHGATSKATPVNADEIGLWDSVTGTLQKLTWANLKATLKTYFDTLYAAAGSYQPLATILSTLSALANGSGVLTNNGSGGLSWATSTTSATFFPSDNEPPSSNYAVFGTRNGHPYLAFDTTTQWSAIFTGRLPRTYPGNGLTVYVDVMMASAITGTVGFDVAFERIDASSLDLDADSFATAKTITATTVPGTSGQILTLSVSFTNSEIDGLQAGEAFRLRLRRDVATDTAAGDAQVTCVEVKAV